MPDRLPKYFLGFNAATDKWQLKNEQGRVVRNFSTKAEATAGGVLQDALGKNGGSVIIRLAGGEFQEERTFPRSRDPSRSPG